MRKRCLVIVLIGLAIVVFVAQGLAAVTGATRDIVSNKYFLFIDGANAGLLKSVSGGGVSAAVIDEPAGSGLSGKKHIGQPRYQSVTLQLGLGNAKRVYDWIAASWKSAPPTREVSIEKVDYRMQVKSTRKYSRSFIEETTIPAMDGAGKEPVYLTVMINPQSTHEEAGGTTPEGNIGANDRRVFLPSNYRLDIDGMDCTKVNKIDAFTVKRTLVSDNIGGAHDFGANPTRVVFPNLKITMAEETSESWRRWFDDFVVKGNNDQSKERNGTLTFLSPDHQSELARVRFFNVGIYSLEDEKAESNADQIAHVTVELYVERMEFEVLGVSD